MKRRSEGGTYYLDDDVKTILQVTLAVLLSSGPYGLPPVSPRTGQARSPHPSPDRPRRSRILRPSWGKHCQMQLVNNY